MTFSQIKECAEKRRYEGQQQLEGFGFQLGWLFLVVTSSLLGCRNAAKPLRNHNNCHSCICNQSPPPPN